MKLLQQFLSQHFSYEELLFFCFDEQAFNIIYQNLPKPPQVVNAEIIANQLKPQLLNQILHHTNQHDLRAKLENWAKRCKPKEYAEMIPLKEIPVVIAAMRRTEFAKLIKDKPEIKELFNQLVTMLDWSLNDLKKCYGKTPSDWKPWQGDSVQVILSETENYLTSYKKDECNLKLADKSELFFQGDVTIIREFEKKESILIIDALSMYYEPMRNHLKDLGVFASTSKTLVLVISPIIETAFLIGQRLRDDIYKGELQRAFDNFNKCHQFFTFHINDKRVLQQFLLAMSPQIHQAEEIYERMVSITTTIERTHKTKKRGVDNLFIAK